MVKDDKKGVYKDAEELGEREKNIPHAIDSIYEKAEQDGKKTTEKQDSFMKPEEEDLAKKPKKAKTFKEEEGIYEEAEKLAKKEKLKPAETDSIYKEAEILGEKTKEDIDNFMAEPEKK